MRLLLAAPTGDETASVVQLDPSHRSATGVVSAVLPRTTAPTAMQAAADVHEMSLRPALVLFWSAGVVSADHAAPVH
jgi:hypothetical protein